MNADKNESARNMIGKKKPPSGKKPQPILMQGIFFHNIRPLSGKRV